MTWLPRREERREILGFNGKSLRHKAKEMEIGEKGRQREVTSERIR